MSILVNIPLVLHDFCEKKAKSTEINKTSFPFFLPGKLYILSNA